MYQSLLSTILPLLNMYQLRYEFVKLCKSTYIANYNAIRHKFLLYVSSILHLYTFYFYAYLFTLKLTIYITYQSMLY